MVFLGGDVGGKGVEDAGVVDTVVVEEMQDRGLKVVTAGYEVERR